MRKPLTRPSPSSVSRKSLAANRDTQRDLASWSAAALDAACLGAWVRDLAAGTIHLDDRAQSILGLASPSPVTAFYARIHAGDVESMRRAEERALSLHEVDGRYRVALRIVRSEGALQWVEVRARAQRVARGKAGAGRLRLVGTLGMLDEPPRSRMAAAWRRPVGEPVLAEHARLADDRIRSMDEFPFGVWLKDAAGRFQAVNRRHAETYGLSPQQMIGKTESELVEAPIAARRGESDRLVMGERRALVEELYLACDGTTGWFESYKAPVIGADGAVIGVAGCLHDIGERKALEVARESALSEANRLARMRSEFLANMSHEIRTPLNAVLGLAQSGIRDNAGRRSVQTFQRILDSGQMLLGVVNDILDYTKIEAGKVVLERVAFALGDAVDRAVNLLAQQLYAKGITFNVTEASDLPVTCLGDPLRVSQILVNLLSNAAKFTERGEVGVLVERDGAMIAFQVSDTGVGMSAEVVDRLFQPFEQADASTTRRYGGTGLGLTITRRLIDMMGGTIEVQSRPQAGSRFTVRLPLEHVPCAVEHRSGRVGLVGLQRAEVERLCAELGNWGLHAEVVAPDEVHAAHCDLLLFSAAGSGEAALAPIGEFVRNGGRVAFVQTPGEADVPFGYLDAHTPIIDRPLRARQVAGIVHPAPGVQTEQTIPAPRLRGIRVLAAEDSEVNRIVLEDLLKAEGVTLTAVENGRMAVECVCAAGADAFDVVLTDIHMPELDGYETARRIRAMAPRLPVIGVTARSMSEERERCLDAGMVAHVAKPIDAESLIDAIRTHCGLTDRSGPCAPQDAASARSPERARAPVPFGQVDWPGIEIRYRGRAALIDKLIAATACNHATTAARLRDASRCRDFEAVAFLAHSVKGLAGNFVAGQLAGHAGEVEELARKQSEHALELANQLATDVEQFIAALSVQRRSA